MACMEPGAISQGMHGLLPIAGQVLEDCSTGWVGEGREKIVGYGLHVETIIIRLLVCLARMLRLCSPADSRTAFTSHPPRDT